MLLSSLSSLFCTPELCSTYPKLLTEQSGCLEPGYVCLFPELLLLPWMLKPASITSSFPMPLKHCFPKSAVTMGHTHVIREVSPAPGYSVYIFLLLSFSSYCQRPRLPSVRPFELCHDIFNRLYSLDKRQILWMSNLSLFLHFSVGVRRCSSIISSRRTS